MSGVVYLVGAGPGDPGLLTVRALDLIASADTILYDRLIPAGALAGARPDAELVYVGKEAGGPQVDQAETERLLVEHARAGRRVVRLKGGDPFVFGRGGEEGLALREAGVAFEVVPGVTAGVAAPAYAGIPVTHRELASGVAFVTGHESEPSLDWSALAAFPGTLVFYMGVRALPGITERLLSAGRAPDEPAAVVERGTLPGQRTVVATLADIATRASLEGIRAPAVTVVGAVARLREQLAWLEARPLFGRTVAVTRAREQASALAARLRSLGAAVVEAPAIRTVALDTALPELEAYDLVCVTSPVGASQLWSRLRAAGLDARALAGRRVAAIGPGTARALEERGIVADVVPARAVAEGLVEALADEDVASALVLRAREGRDVLSDALRARGASVDVVALYETLPEPLDDETAAAAREADYLTFTSASTVRFFVAAAGEDALRGPRVASIGPATSEALRAHGVSPDLEADPHTPDGLVDALVADAERLP
jgi:uroporphyrinogen III methyltransferase/synthase